MTEIQRVQLTASEIGALTMNVDTIPLSAPTKELLTAILTAIRAVLEDQASTVTVTVETESALQDQIQAAFTPDAVDDPLAAGDGVKVTVKKVGRDRLPPQP